MAKAKKADDKPADSASLQVSIEDFVRTRDSVVTGLATLQSAVQDLSRAYIAHTNTVIGKSPGSSLELLNLAGPLGGENAIFGGNRAATPAAPQTIEAGESKKRKRAPHDKNAPKRPVTPYFLYMKTARAEIAKEMTPGHSAKEVADEGTKRWLTMPAKEKKEWSDRYQVNFAAYKAKMKEYKAGKPIPEISDAEARKLLEEMQKRGEIKSEAPLEVGGPNEASEASDSSDDSSSSSEDEAPQPAKEPSPPKSPQRASKRRKRTSTEKKSSPVKQTPAKEVESASSAAAERVNKSSELEKKKKSTKKKDSKAVDEVESKPTPAPAAVSSPPKSTAPDSQQKPKKSKKKRKSEAVDE